MFVPGKRSFFWETDLLRNSVTHIMHQDLHLSGGVFDSFSFNFSDVTFFKSGYSRTNMKRIYVVKKRNMQKGPNTCPSMYNMQILQLPTDANKAEKRGRAFEQTTSKRIEGNPDFLEFIFFQRRTKFYLSGQAHKCGESDCLVRVG